MVNDGSPGLTMNLFQLLGIPSEFTPNSPQPVGLVPRIKQGSRLAGLLGLPTGPRSL